MTNKSFIATILDMLLQRRLVVMLNNYYINNGSGLSRDEFVNYVCNKMWPRLLYFWPQKDKFHNRINLVLGDCIRGGLSYIAEDDDGKTLLVTTKGREFISILSLGFYEEFRKRRKRSTDIIHERFTGGIITILIISIVWIIKHFSPIIKNWWPG